MKKKIDFTGPSAADLGIRVGEDKNRDTESNITQNSNTDFSITKNSDTKTKPTTKKETFYRKIIRDYLNNALGDKESVELKLSDIQEAIGVNVNTFYKHLRTLREEDFKITRLRYSTLIQRRTPKD